MAYSNRHRGHLPRRADPVDSQTTPARLEVTTTRSHTGEEFEGGYIFPGNHCVRVGIITLSLFLTAIGSGLVGGAITSGLAA